MSRVIVLEPSSLDLSSADEFGEIEYVSGTHFNLFNIDGIVQKTKSKLIELEYEPTEDYICLTGQGQKLSIFVATVASLYNEFFLLMFDARETRYKKRIFRNASNRA